MISILVVDDNLEKLNKIERTIIDRHESHISDIDSAKSMKEARRFVYEKKYDLLVLDLLIPIEEGGDCNGINAVNFLKEIEVNPQINPPIHIVGLSGFKDKVEEFEADFKSKLWNLIDYNEDSTYWSESLNSIIYHLLRTRENFLAASIEKKADFLFSKLRNENMPNPFLGFEWLKIINNLSSIIQRSLEIPIKFKNGDKAKNINSSSLKISSEYDFQNLIHLILRPWLPSTEPENLVIVFDGSKKNADFSVKSNSIIIEAKYIDSSSSKSAVVKTLEGLKRFYSNNSNIKALLFLILVEENIDFDGHMVESEFSILTEDNPVLVKTFTNSLSK